MFEFFVVFKFLVIWVKVWWRLLAKSLSIEHFLRRFPDILVTKVLLQIQFRFAELVSVVLKDAISW